MEHLCHMNTYHLKVSNTFSKFNHTVNQSTKSLTMTPTSFLKFRNLFLYYIDLSKGFICVYIVFLEVNTN